MRKLILKIYKFLNIQEGQGMVEYALIISLVAIVVIAAIVLFGPSLTGIFNKASNSLSNTVS